MAETGDEYLGIPYTLLLYGFEIFIIKSYKNFSMACWYFTYIFKMRQASIFQNTCSLKLQSVHVSLYF